MDSAVQEKWESLMKNRKVLPVDYAKLSDIKAYGRGMPAHKDIPLPIIHYIIYNLDNTLYSYILDFGILVESKEQSIEKIVELTVKEMKKHVKKHIVGNTIDKLFDNSVYHDSTAWGHYGYFMYRTEINRLKTILSDAESNFQKEELYDKIDYIPDLNYAA